MNGYFELEMDAAGGLRIVKTSEDGNVSGIEFTITGEDYSERVRTGSDGTIDVTGLMPGQVHRRRDKLGCIHTAGLPDRHHSRG